MDLNETQLQRFRASYSTPEDGCWEWTRNVGGHGYGRFSTDRWYSAHRVQFELCNGPIPEGMFVCHTCDNRICVRPDHLFLGTPRDNVLDMMAKGRQVMRGNIGEASGTSKVTAEQVIEMRERYAAGGVTYASLGLEYGLTLSGVYRIIKRHNWAHLPDSYGDRDVRADRVWLPVPERAA